jgi:general secretion pathway protein L
VIGQRLNTLWRSQMADTAGLLPAWFHAMFLGSPMPRALHFRADVQRIILRNGSVLAPASILSGTAPVPDTNVRGLVSLSLPKSVLMERKLELPGMKGSAALEAARLDLMRRTPFRPNEVYTLMKPMGTKGDFVQWVARKADVDSLVARLASAGLRVGSVRIEGEEAAGILADLTGQALPFRKVWRRTNAALGTALVATIGWLWLSPGLVARQQAQTLAAELDTLRTEATSLRQDVEALRGAQEEQRAFLAGIVGRPRLLDVLRDLTVALPDDVWISDLVFDGKTTVVSGETATSAADLVLTLSRLKEFSNPRLAGPIARTANGSESFELALDLAGGT